MATKNIDLYKYSEKGIKERDIKLWSEIINSFSMNIPFKEKFYLYENNITEKPVCECGCDVKFIDMIKGYREFCSKDCMYNSNKLKERRIKTNIERWGVSNPSSLEVVKEKVKKTNKKKFGHEWATQNENIKSKTKETNIKKWGVDNPMKLDEFKEKVKSTMLERWGVEHSMQSIKIKNDLKEYFLEKWGVDNPLKLPEIREKIESTMLEKWGVKHALQNEEIKKRLRKTNLERWGVDNPSKNEEIKTKIKETNLERWGVDNPSKNEEIKTKIRNSILKKWGTLNLNNIKEISEKINKSNITKFGATHISKNEKWRSEKYKISKDSKYVNYLNNGISIFNCDCGQDHQFEIYIDNYIKRIESNIPLCTKCYPIGDLNSIKEKEFIKFIELNYDLEIIKSYRNNGLEIDIYLPNLKLGFEFNGLYWHSDKFKEKNYHLNKTNHFKEKGIRVIHIWEDDWDFKKEIIKSQILNLLSKSKSIWARKCCVKEITDKKLVRDFLDKNHIQGFVGSNIKLGLFYNGDLLSIMTFDHSEGRKKMELNEWNISRFCNKINMNVVGGASKLLNYFISVYKPSRLVSYADKDWSVGNLYTKLGFNKINETVPDYKYVVKGKRNNKSKFRSNQNISESDMTENFNKVWDCGKIKFEMIIN